jgi:hypothetical protein
LLIFINSFLNIENFPASIFLGESYVKGVNVNPQGQPQGQPEDVQAQVVQSTPNVQSTAQTVPAQEGSQQAAPAPVQKTQEV